MKTERGRQNPRKDNLSAIVYSLICPSTNVKYFYPRLSFLFAFLLLFFVACAGTPKNAPPPSPVENPEAGPPPWVENLEAAFPDDKYIAVRGTGASRETAAQAALRALSAYFQTQVSSRTDLAESYTGRDGVVSQSVQLEQQTLVQTEAELFAVRYTDPWQNSAAGLWEAAAYIDRAEAWAIFEPRLISGTAPFMAVFEAAEGDPEPLRRFFRYKTAENFDAAAMLVYLDFAQVLSPDRAAAFSPVRGAIAALPQRINQAKFDASVYIDCPVDMDGSAATALTNALSAEGLPVTKDRNAASAVCLAVVDEGLEKRDAGTFYNPVLIIGITGKTGEALFSMTISAPRQSAINPDIARRRGYAALAGEIQTKFHTEFEKQITAYNKEEKNL